MPQLPLIACFHGGGSNSTIFRIQAGRLASALATDFEFVFFDGPFVRDAGPGILPAFAECAPFLSWFDYNGTPRQQADGSGYDATGHDGIERTWNLLMTHEPNPRRWVGAMGFSQGTRVVAGLLLDQQRRSRHGQSPSTTSIPLLGFGILCMGSYAPMESEAGYRIGAYGDGDNDSITGYERSADGRPEMGEVVERIGVPTMHMHGLRDGMLGEGRRQRERWFVRGTSQVYEIDYHHAMPWVQAEIEGLAERIRGMAELAGDVV